MAKKKIILESRGGSFANNNIEGKYGTFVWIGSVHVGHEGLSLNGVMYGNKKCDTKEEGEAQILLDLLDIVQPILADQKRKLKKIVQR